MQGPRFAVFLAIGCAAPPVGGPTTTDQTAPLRNQVPEVADQTFVTAEDTFLVAQIAGTDAEGDRITYEVFRHPVRGALTLDADGEFRYAPRAEYSGFDVFAVKVSDALGPAPVPAWMTIEVTSVPDPPEVRDGRFAVFPGQPVEGRVDATDPDNDELTFTVLAQPTGGSVALDESTGTFVYWPAAGFLGVDAFEVGVDDETFTTTATVTVDVRPCEDVEIVAEVVPTAAGAAANGNLDGQGLVFTLVEPPSNGTVVLDPMGAWTYTPDGGFVGLDTFTAVGDDGNCDWLAVEVYILIES